MHLKKRSATSTKPPGWHLKYLQFLDRARSCKAQLVFNHMQRGNALLLEECAHCRRRRNFVPLSISMRTMISPGSDWRKPRKSLPEMPRALPVRL